MERNRFSMSIKNGKKFEKNNKTIALDILYVPYNIKEIRNAYKSKYNFNPIYDGLFRDCSRMGRGQKDPVSKICHTYSTMMKLTTVTPYLKKTPKIYKSCDGPLDFR